MRKVSKSKGIDKVIFEDTHEYHIGKVCGSCKGKAIAFERTRCPYCENGIRWRKVSEKLYNKVKKAHGVK